MKPVNKKPKVGLVIGSGGIKALAAVPLFKFLEEAQIDVDLIIGCSGGSLVGGYWASGHNAKYFREHTDELWDRELFSKTDYRTLLSIAGLPFGRFSHKNGIIKKDKLVNHLKNIWGDLRVEDLPQRMFFHTTDVLSGNPVMIKKGLLWQAVYASSALFPLLPAVEVDGRWLIDGAYSSPLPIMEAVQEGMDVIIAMSFEELTEEPSKGFVPYFMRTSDYLQRWLRRNQTALSVDLHHHEIIFVNVVFDRYISFRATRRIPQILEAGSKVVQEQKHEIEAAIESFSKLKK